MQYDLTNNITSINTKGSAIFGVFDDLNTKGLVKSLDSKDIGNIKDIIKKSSFEGKIGQSLCIYDALNSKLEKIYLVGLGKKNKYSEKNFLKAVNYASQICKKENLKNIFLGLDTFIINKTINIDWAIRNISIQINGIDYVYTETKNKTKIKDIYKPNKVIFICTSVASSYKTKLKKYFAQGLAISNGIKLAKKLGDLPSNICTPTYLANTASALG